MTELKGVGASPSVAYGKLVFLRPYAERRAADISESAADIAAELEKYRSAKAALDRAFSEHQAAAGDVGGSEAAEIFEFYKLMLTDDDLDDMVLDFITKEHLTAVSAVNKAISKLSEIFKSLPSEYMRERESDLVSLRDRLVETIDGHSRDLSLDLPVIIAANDLTPADTLELRGQNILGFALENGSINSHTAILARSMSIPAVCRLGELPRELDGAMAVIDGERGSLIIEPSRDQLEEVKRRQISERERKLEFEALRGKPTATKSGKQINLLANVGDIADIKNAIASDCEGIGLFRSEFLYLKHTVLPSEEAQLAVYRKAVELMNGRELTIRTLDIGADKQLPYMKLSEERNPTLGVRGIRVSLQKRELFASQLRAILRASAYGNVSIMLPMITTEAELDAAVAIYNETRNKLCSDGVKLGSVQLGIMIETPSAALISDKLAQKADFFSIGTNDLIQYTLAADRENGALSELTAGLPEAVKRLIAMTVNNAKKAGIPVSVCGEAAGEAENARYFLDIGVDKLSLSPSRILNIRYEISKLD